MQQPAFTPAPGTTRVIRDVAYAPPDPPTSAGHLLDLYLPVNGPSPAPLVIWSHGSGWLAENGREGAAVVAEHLTPHGFAVAGVAVRSSAFAQFPGQVHDVKAAIRWLRANAPQYQLDAGHFGIMGESSGGWTAAMAGVTGDVTELEGEIGFVGVSSTVQAVVPIYPPIDFLQMDAHMPDGGVAFKHNFGLSDGHADTRSPESLLLGGPILECPDGARRANPATYARAAVPPFLIIHGQCDVFVPSHQSEILYDALATAGADVTLILLPRGGHGPWEAFFTDPAVRDDASLRSSRHGQRQREQRVELNWNTVIRFFNMHLRHC